MTPTEVKGCMFLMSQLWTSYKAPETEEKINAAVSTWMPFFATVPEKQVTQAIMEIAAEGSEFAPQIGQIYRRVKAKKQERIAAKKHDEKYYNLCCLFARIAGIEQPQTMGNDELKSWFEEARTRVR